MPYREAAVERRDSPTATVLDMYLAAAALGPEYRHMIAMREFGELSPQERLELRQSAQQIAGTDLPLSEDYAQSVLLLSHLNEQARLEAA